MLPIWLGAGTAFEAFAERPSGLAMLRRMAKTWPFFDDLIGKMEMVCAKADLEIAALYFDRLCKSPALFGELRSEFERTPDERSRRDLASTIDSVKLSRDWRQYDDELPEALQVESRKEEVAIQELASPESTVSSATRCADFAASSTSPTTCTPWPNVQSPATLNELAFFIDGVPSGKRLSNSVTSL